MVLHGDFSTISYYFSLLRAEFSEASFIRYCNTQWLALLHPVKTSSTSPGWECTSTSRILSFMPFSTRGIDYVGMRKSVYKPQLMACLVKAYSWLECGAMWCSDVVKSSSKPVLQIEMELCGACLCLLCLFVKWCVNQWETRRMQWLAALVDVYNVYFFTYIHWHCVCMSTDWCLHVLLRALEKKRFIVSIPAHVLVLFVSVFGHICFQF